MRAPALRIIGHGLLGLLIVGCFGVAVLAVLKGEPYLWRNYWGASVTSWGAIVTFGVVILGGVIWVAQRLRRRLRAPRE